MALDIEAWEQQYGISAARDAASAAANDPIKRIGEGETFRDDLPWLAAIDYAETKWRDWYQPTSGQSIAGATNQTLYYTLTDWTADSTRYNQLTEVNTGDFTSGLDTSTFASGCRVRIKNDSGSDHVLADLIVTGRPWHRFGPAHKAAEEIGLVHNKFVDEEDVYRNGERILRVANQAIAKPDLANALADYHWKVCQTRRHVYICKLIGTRHDLSPGERYTLQIGSGATKEYYTDSTVECYDVDIQYDRDNRIGTTIATFREVYEGWSKTMSAAARFMLSGNWRRNVIGEKFVTVNPAGGTKMGAMEYCDGTADEVQINSDTQSETAIHEAAHAVMAIGLLPFQYFETVSIVQGKPQIAIRNQADMDSFIKGNASIKLGGLSFYPGRVDEYMKDLAVEDKIDIIERVVMVRFAGYIAACIAGAKSPASFPDKPTLEKYGAAGDFNSSWTYFSSHFNLPEKDIKDGFRSLYDTAVKNVIVNQALIDDVAKELLELGQLTYDQVNRGVA